MPTPVTPVLALPEHHVHRDWTCPHGTDARTGCLQCHLDGDTHEPPTPLWEVGVRFTTERPLPPETLQAIHRHPRSYAIAEEGENAYFLASGPRAADRAQAVADVVGMLVFSINPDVIGQITVIGIEARRP